MHSSSLLTTMYATSWVLVLEVCEFGKLSSSSSCCSMCWKDCAGFFLALSLIIRSFITVISSGLSGRFFVLYKFYLSWCKCFFTVATEVGRCFNRPDVNPGHVLKYFSFITFSNVDFTGDKQSACKYCTNSVCVFFFWSMTVMDGLCNVTGAYYDASFLIFLSIEMLSMLSLINWLKWRNSFSNCKSCCLRYICFSSLLFN